MAWNFAESWDCYAVGVDMVQGYWDSGANPANFTFATGRFSGSRALQWSAANATLVKSSGANETAHHLVVAFWQSAALTGSTLATYLQLLDGTTAQCSIVFRSDGTILLTSGGPAGTVLATYAGAVTATSTWYAFEFEVIVHNSTGSFKVRKNGNTVDDHSTTGIDTAGGTANNYANKLQLGQNAASGTQTLDDLYWRSDASSLSWLGDMRCTARYPASDAAVQFSRTPTSNIQTTAAAASTQAITTANARYTPFTAAYDGTIATATVSLGTGYTGNLKCSIFASSGSAPTTVLGSANVVSNPVANVNTLTFSTPVAVTKGTSYWIGFSSDTASGTWSTASTSTGGSSTTVYASFPVASPTISTANNLICTLTIALSSNATVVNEPQQDATTSYVYDSVVGHSDLYGIAPIASTPLVTHAVVTRAYAIKSDAGTRTMAVQLKSGSSTVASPTVVLTPSNWQWAWRHDTTDPATSGAWTAAAVNLINVGPLVVA